MRASHRLAGGSHGQPDHTQSGRRSHRPA